MPALIMYGDDDQIVPIGAAALLSSKRVKNTKLKIYTIKVPRTGIKDQINED